jgi:putative ATP-dependent endonuclease of the OLD family
MRASRVRVRDFRGLADVTVGLDAFTSLIGLNGAGKSTVLYALDWFFNGTDLSERDHHCDEEDRVEEKLSVEVVFSDLSARELADFRLYVRRGELSVKRTRWLGGDEKLTGNARQGPGFGAVRSIASKVERRAAYAQLRTQVSELPAVTTGDAVLDELRAWEDNPANEPRLEEVAETDVSYFFGFNGANVLESAFRFILVPASPNLEQIAGDSHRGSAVDELLGALVSSTARAASDEWMESHEEDISALSVSITDAIRELSAAQSEAVNSHLSDLVPDAEVEFRVSVSLPSFRATAAVQTMVEVSGSNFPLSNHGHGLQRSVLISMLQATEVLRSQDEEHASPTFLLAIEEPEVYQHPLRARSFGTALAALATAGGWQVVVATHSPYFVRPASFDSVRLVRKEARLVEVVAGSVAAVAAMGGWDEARIRQHLERLVPTHVSEAFFAEGAVLVEGVTEKVIFEEAARLLDVDLDRLGIAIVECGGKENISVVDALIRHLGIRTSLVFDGDYFVPDDPDPEKRVRQERRATSFRSSTTRLVDWLVSAGIQSQAERYEFGAPTRLEADHVILREHLNVEIAGWSSLVAALDDLGESPKTKNPYALRAAASLARVEDMPQSIQHVVTMAESMHH